MLEKLLISWDEICEDKPQFPFLKFFKFHAISFAKNIQIIGE